MIQPINIKSNKKSINDIALKFYWSNRDFVHQENAALNIDYTKYSNNLGGYYPLLGIEFLHLEENKEDGTSYILLIDRYRKKAWKSSRTNFTKTRTAGYKHEALIDAAENNRKSEIEITSDKMLLDFGQPQFFKTAMFPNLKGFNKTRQLNIAKVKIAFRIRKTKGTEIQESKHIGYIDMIGMLTKTGRKIDYVIK